MKRAISILLSCIFIFTSVPCAYTHPQVLASRSLFKLWEEKGINPTIGLTIEARLSAIHKSILEGRYDPATLESIDKRTSAGNASGYIFDYNIIRFKDNRAFGMRANLYKDKHGEQQLILFYNPDNPPWELLEKYGVRTPEDKEFVKRGWWVSSSKDPVDPTRRALLTLIALAVPAALVLPVCVFDVSGLPVEDGGTKPDGGVLPIDTIDRSIDASKDTGNNPVTIFENSSFSSEDATQRLSPLSQFVRNNNAAFRYTGAGWHWTLSESDRTNILNNGFTYIFNGRNHKVKLIGQGNDGRTKAIIFNTQTPAMPNYTQPYRVSINKELIQQLAQEIGLGLSTINIYFENLEPAEELVLNGFQKQYAVLATTGDVIPDRINPQYSIFSLGGASVNTVPIPEGINISYTMTSGNDGQSGGINIPTRSGGIDLADPALQLQGAWRMDGADLGADSGPNGNVLTNINGVESVPGRYGNAAQFVASDQSYLTIPSGEQTGLHITGDITVSAWINITDFPSGNFIIAGRLANSDLLSDYTFYVVNDGTNRMGSWNGSIAVFSDAPVPLGSWHHVAFVRSGNQIIFYLDGEEIGSSTQEFPNTVEGAPFFVGSNSAANTYANGLIDELAVLDRALTPDEVQDLYNQVDSSNFQAPGLATTEFKVRGNSPFILRLTDNLGEILDVYTLGLDLTNWRSIIINILEAQAIMNPSFNLGNVASVQILVNDTFLPTPDGEVFNGTIDIQGLVGIPPTTRHRYATDPHDKDITADDYRILIENLPSIPHTENRVIEIREWQDILLSNGLGFVINGRIYSAFTGPDGKIYIPAPELAKAGIKIEDNYIRNRTFTAIERRNSIILGHEIDEINNPDHREAVFNEFSDNSIDGLNYADVVTVLLETLSGNNIAIIDNNFHRQFIANLLMQGVFLDKEGNTYLSIVREIVDDRVNEDSLLGLYRDILAEISGLVTSPSHRFIHRRLPKEETTIPETELEKEPGFKELFNTIREQKGTGTIYIDIAKFFVRNKSLATEDEVSTIDFEYLKRFVAIVRRLQDTDVKVKGIYSQSRQRLGLIEQLTSIIREDLDLNDEQFPIQAVDFTNYLEYIGGSEAARGTISILTEDSWKDIADRSQLKIVDSVMDRYNRVNSSGWEFYTALRGLSYDTPEGFLKFVVKEVLQQLITQRVITDDEAQNLKDQITKYGIAFIPTFFDPIQYYKTIESQKALLTAA